MGVNPNEDTEFNDALRKHGILPPRPKTPSTPPLPPSPTLDDLLNDFDEGELRELAEDAKDDEAELAINSYRLQRSAAERLEELKSRFGRIYPIGREDYIREVTEASKVDEIGDEQGKGTGVICFLYKDGLPRSDKAFQHVRALATKYPRSKFVSIVGDRCIADLPDSRIPLLILYRKGEVRKQIVAWGADRERRQEELEAVLLLAGVIDVPEHQLPKGQRRDDQGLDDQEEDPLTQTKSFSTTTNAKLAKNIRHKDDSDSDFEFDL